jgi:hypothetical protein
VKILKKAVKNWLLLVVVITLLLGINYIVIQQNLRLSGNDPQIQMALDSVLAFEAGLPVDQILPDKKVDIAKSLSPFMIIYDLSGNVIASNAVLHNQTPLLPEGVLSYADQHGENRITYQPEPGVRSAVVIMPINSETAAYILVGRSLREVESRISLLTTQIGLGWGLSLFISLIATLVLEFIPFTRTKFIA